MLLQHPVYAGPGCYGVAMPPGGPAMMPNVGMVPAAYGMPAMYNLQPVYFLMSCIKYPLEVVIHCEPHTSTITLSNVDETRKNLAEV